MDLLQFHERGGYESPVCSELSVDLANAVLLSSGYGPVNGAGGNITESDDYDYNL